MTARMTAAQLNALRGKAGRRITKRPEQELQVAATRWMRANVPPPPDGPAWTAINPVPGKTKVSAGLSKAMGMRAGVSDWVLDWRGKAIWIEWKAGSGKSQAQREWDLDLELCGSDSWTCRSIDDLRAVLDHYGIPLEPPARQA